MLKPDWTAWHTERARYAALESLGFKQDIAELTEHVEKLREVAPREKAGAMLPFAYTCICKLQARLDVAKACLAPSVKGGP